MHDLSGREYSSPLQETVAGTILGNAEFVSAIQERHLSGKKADRDLPSLRELSGKLSLDEIVQAVNKVFREDSRQATKASIYLCHRYSGAKLKAIGELFQLSESGVTQASRRFGQEVDRDNHLKEMIKEIVNEVGVSNV